MVAALGFALARERLLRGFSLLLSHSIRTSPSPFFATLLLYFPVAIFAALSCFCRRRSASNILAKLVLALPFFLAASNLTVVLAPSWPALSVLSTAVAGAPPPSTFCSAVVARIVDLLHRCFSGPILCSIEFGVSSWFFPSCICEFRVLPSCLCEFRVLPNCLYEFRVLPSCLCEFLVLSELFV